MKQTKHMMPDSHCLACGYLTNAASFITGPDRTIPKPGDVSVCLQCGHLMSFNDDLSLRELTGQEMYAVAGDRRILDIQRARAVIMGKKEDG